MPAPPYRDYQWRPGDGVRHAAEIAGYSRQLADRLDALLAQGTSRWCSAATAAS